MPSYMPETKVARTLDEKLTFYGEGVAALAELMIALRKGTSPDELSEDVRAVYDLLYGELQDEKAADTHLFKYLPENEQHRTFPARLILRGTEVQAFCRLMDERQITDDEVDALDEFKRRFIDEGRKAHVDPTA